MNSYKISYSTVEGNAQYIVTERSEAAARKVFKAQHKGAEISDIELVDVNVAATKAQERETLEKIKAMVEELGPSSYLATAFEGTFEDAETNIENDFAFSMKALADAEAQLAAAQEQIAALKRQQLPEELRRDLWVMTTTEAEASRARMAEAAEKMAVGADNPGCVLFKDAVTLYRAEKARAEAMEQRAAELDALEGEEGGAA